MAALKSIWLPPHTHLSFNIRESNVDCWANYVQKCHDQSNDASDGAEMKLSATAATAAAAPARWGKLSRCKIVLCPVLTQHNLRASIPSHILNRQAIIRYVPTDLFNDEIFIKLTSPSHIKLLKVERINRRIINDDKSTALAPFKSILLTFEDQNLPSHVFLFYVRYEISVIFPKLKCALTALGLVT